MIVLGSIEKLKTKRIIPYFVFPLALIYFECVFRLSTQGTVFTFPTLAMMLFSASWGSFLCFITSLFKNPKIKYTLTAVFLGVCAVLYLVEYFVYRQFKIFYDVNTVLSGAGDAMSGFLDVALQLIFSLDGIFKILLFFLPIILYLIFGSLFFVSELYMDKNVFISLNKFFILFTNPFYKYIV